MTTYTSVTVKRSQVGFLVPTSLFPPSIVLNTLPTDESRVLDSSEEFEPHISDKEAVSAHISLWHGIYVREWAYV